jgi:hypothetical protein
LNLLAESSTTSLDAPPEALSELEKTSLITYDAMGYKGQNMIGTCGFFCYYLPSTRFARFCLFDFWETNTCPLGIKPTILLGEYGGNITPTEMRNIQSENNLPDSIELGFHVKFTVCG